jgi:hypothetical protein
MHSSAPNAAAPTVWWIGSCASRSDRSPRLAAQAPPCLKSPARAQEET